MIRRVWEAIGAALRRFWEDVKASTDPSLLGVARFLGLLYGRIDTRLPIDQALRQSLRRRLPAHASWRHAFGGITYLFFIVLVVTGALLTFHYRPSAQEAYQSIQYIVAGVRLGWLVRDLHVWAANLIVLTALVHMARVFFEGTYKPPRETNWIAGLLLLFVVFAFGATGYLLPWDQWAYWTVTEGLDILARVPLIGAPVVELLRADPIVSGATLSRFFAVHVIILPWVAFSLLVLHFAMVRKHGIAPPKQPVPESRGVLFFPHHLLRSFMVSIAVLMVTITVAIFYPRQIGDPANPAAPPGVLISSWVGADVARALSYYLGPWGLSAFIVIGIGLALLPLFDRDPERSLRRHPGVTALGIAFFAGFVLAWVVGRQLRNMPPQTGNVPVQMPAATPGPPRAPNRATPAPARPDTAHPRRQP